MRNTKTLATLLRVFAALTAMSQIYIIVIPQFDAYAERGESVEGLLRSISILTVAMVYPVLVFVGAYLLEFLHDFRDRALEQTGADGTEV